MENSFQGLEIPRYDLPPVLRMDLLDEVQDLLIKYEYIDEKVNIEDFIDSSFVEEAWKKLN